MCSARDDIARSFMAGDTRTRQHPTDNEPGTGEVFVPCELSVVGFGNSPIGA